MSSFCLKNNGFRAVVRMSVLAAGVAFAGLGAFGSAQAAKPAPATTESHAMPDAHQRAQFEHARMELMQDERQLAQIQGKTLKHHPELQKRQQAFLDMMTKEMKRRGHSPHKDMVELRALAGKLHGKSLSDADRRKLTQQFEQKLIAFQRARDEAMKSPKLQKARANLAHAVLAAMKKEDPKTESLLKQVTEKRRELMQMHAAAMGGVPKATHKGMAK